MSLALTRRWTFHILGAAEVGRVAAQLDGGKPWKGGHAFRFRIRQSNFQRSTAK
jgi:hypothetical protein